MIRIPAVAGVYELECDSNGTYHELAAKLVGTFNGNVYVEVLKTGAASFEALSSAPVAIGIVTSTAILGTIEAVRITLSNASGSGYAEVQLISRDTGIPDSIAKSRAYVQSIARLYPTGVALVTSGRPRLNYVAIQNRDATPMYFWHGLVPTDITQTAYLPIDPATWTTPQRTAAEDFIETYGERLGANERLEPNVAQTGPLYSFVPSGTSAAHVKVG